MTEKEVQQIACEAIVAADPQPEKYYHLCWWQEQLQCHHVRHTNEMHQVFYAAPGQTFADGLTRHQWRLVVRRIMEFCQQRRLALSSDATGRKPKASARSSTRKLQVTTFDSMRLCALLASVRTPNATTNAPLDKLQQLLETADTVNPHQVDNDIVTMNSQVHLHDDRENSDMTLSLVFPADALDDADFDRMKVSVLTPIGLSLLGRRVGDTVGGRVKIDQLMYQPEAAGNFHL